jgi:hypothetical protein
LLVEFLAAGPLAIGRWIKRRGAQRHGVRPRSCRFPTFHSCEMTARQRQQLRGRTP